jgi:predicted esterase
LAGGLENTKIIKLFKMFARITAVFIGILFIAPSCKPSQDKSQQNETQVQAVSPKEQFQAGQIIQKVICKTDTSQSYALYLPGDYSTEKKFPVIYIFDPHGDGNLPVSLYKDLAEKYHLILIGSNNSKNGNSWEASEAIANTLFSDSQNRLSINTERITVLGFSGGARIANALAVVNGSISSVICCGAATPAINIKDPRNNYTYLGIAGNTDFNYVEMRKYDMLGLAGRPVKHVFLEFDGKHEWPPVDVMQTAFVWDELNAMRKKTAIKNDSLIISNLQLFANQLKRYQNENKPFEIFNQVRKTINFFDGLTNLDEYYKIYNTVKQDPEIDRALKKEEFLWKQEEQLEGKYLEAFTKESKPWWNNEIASLQKKIKTTQDEGEMLVYKRTLYYLSLAAYMQTNAALNENNLPAAKFFCEIYLLVDPGNPDAHYFMSLIEKGENSQ